METTFAMSVNGEDLEKVKLVTTVIVKDEDSSNNLLEVSVEGVYDTDNNQDSVKLNDFENPSEMVNDLMPDISEIIAFITNKIYGIPLEINPKVSPDFLENNKM